MEVNAATDYASKDKHIRYKLIIVLYYHNFCFIKKRHANNLIIYFTLIIILQDLKNAQIISAFTMIM